METTRKAIVYIASSLDGFIAKPNDDLGFLSMVEKEGEDYGYTTFIESVDIVILGRKTYDWVMSQVPEFPHSGIPTYVITRSARPAIGTLVFYTGNLRELVTRLKHERGKHIFIDGGSEIVNALLQHGLIDEIILSVIPVLLGEGVSLFAKGRPEQSLQLLEAKSYATGLVQLHYRCVPPAACAGD